MNKAVSWATSKYYTFKSYYRMRNDAAGLLMSALLLIAACCGIRDFSIQKTSKHAAEITRSVGQKVEQSPRPKVAVGQRNATTVISNQTQDTTLVYASFFIQSTLTSHLINTFFI